MSEDKESKWRHPVVTPPEGGQTFWEKGEVKGTGSGLGQGCALPFLRLPPPLAGYFPSAFNCSELQFSLLLNGNCTTSWGECLRVTGILPTPLGLMPGVSILMLSRDRGLIAIPCLIVGRATQYRGEAR